MKDGCWNCKYAGYVSNPIQTKCKNVASNRVGLINARRNPAPCKGEHTKRQPAEYPCQYLIRSLLASAVPELHVVFRSIPLLFGAFLVREFQADISASFSISPLVVHVVWIYLVMHALMPLIMGTFYRLMDQVYAFGREKIWEWRAQTSTEAESESQAALLRHSDQRGATPSQAL